MIKQFFKGFRKGFKDFGHNISSIVNTILLSIVYFIGVGLSAILARLLNKHLLDLKPSNKAKTYWSDLNLKKKPIEEYYKQF